MQSIESTNATDTQDFSLENDAGKQFLGRIRIPVKKGKYPVAFLVAALETGRTVVDLIPQYDDLIVVSLDYPLSVEPITLGNALQEISALRRGGAETVAGILLTLDWLLTLPVVDVKDVTLIAVSFGVFTAIPAAAVDARITRLVILQGGGDLSRVISANASRLGLPLPPKITAWLGSLFLSPFEPSSYIAQVSPRPVIIVASQDDAYFPRSTVEFLYRRAKEPKELIWFSGEHLGLEKVAMLQEFTLFIVKKLYGK